MKCIHGKIVLITGAASGIGRAMADRFARDGAQLHLLDIDAPGLDKLVREMEHRGVDCSCTICDLARPDDIDRAIRHTLSQRSHIDILVNNAGISYYGPTLEMTGEQCEQILAVNYLAPIRLTRGFLPILLSRRESHIVNVSSMYGFFVTPRSAAYHASKYGLVGFSDALRAEFSRFGLGVTTLCPGYVRTRLYENLLHPANKSAPQPPRWLTAGPEAVADRAIRSVYRNQRLATVTILARVAYDVNRLFPGLLDSLYRLGRRRTFAVPTHAQPQLRLFDPDGDMRHVGGVPQTIARAA
jgi:short-subunit dehydrogenase